MRGDLWASPWRPGGEGERAWKLLVVAVAAAAHSWLATEQLGEDDRKAGGLGLGQAGGGMSWAGS